MYEMVSVYSQCQLGCAQIWTNYINRPLPKGGNGFGAVPAGSQTTQGALGMGEAIAVSNRITIHTILCCSLTCVPLTDCARVECHHPIFQSASLLPPPLRRISRRHQIWSLQHDLLGSHHLRCRSRPHRCRRCQGTHCQWNRQNPLLPRRIHSRHWSWYAFTSLSPATSTNITQPCSSPMSHPFFSTR